MLKMLVCVYAEHKIRTEILVHMSTWDKIDFENNQKSVEIAICTYHYFDSRHLSDQTGICKGQPQKSSKNVRMSDVSTGLMLCMIDK